MLNTSSIKKRPVFRTNLRLKKYRSLNEYNFTHHPALTGTPAKKKRNHIEDDECKELKKYLQWLMYETKQIVHFTHIPNETYTPYKSVQKRNKLMGVQAGFPDYVIVIPGKVIYIEMKAPKGTVSPSQKEWIKVLQATGAVVEVCKGFEQAKLFIQAQLGMV